MKILFIILLLTISVKADWACITNPGSCNPGSQCLKDGYVLKDSTSNDCNPPSYFTCIGNPYCGGLQKLQACLDYNFKESNQKQKESFFQKIMSFFSKKQVAGICVPSQQCSGQNDCSTYSGSLLRYCQDQGFKDQKTTPTAHGCGCVCKNETPCEQNVYCPTTQTAVSWARCIQAETCSDDCISAGYIKGNDNKCLPPLYETCSAQNQCSEACLNYGFQNQNNKCIPTSCLSQDYSLPCRVNTSYCQDLGFVNNQNNVCTCDTDSAYDEITKKCNRVKTTWNYCVKQVGSYTTCPEICLNAGYVLDQKTQCTLPKEICSLDQACDDKNKPSNFKQACLDYGYQSDANGKCENKCYTYTNKQPCDQQLCVDTHYTFSNDVCGCLSPFYVQDATSMQCIFQYTYDNCTKSSSYEPSCPKVCLDQGFTNSETNTCIISLDTCIPSTPTNKCQTACLQYIGLPEDDVHKGQTCTIPDCKDATQVCSQYCLERNFTTEATLCNCSPNNFYYYQVNKQNYCLPLGIDTCLNQIKTLNIPCPDVCINRGYLKDEKNNFCVFNPTTCIGKDIKACNCNSDLPGQCIQACIDAGFENQTDGVCKFSGCYSEKNKCADVKTREGLLCQNLRFVSQGDACMCQSNYFSDQGKSFCLPIKTQNCLNQKVTCTKECLNAGYDGLKTSCTYPEFQTCVKEKATVCDVNSQDYKQACIGAQFKSQDGKCQVPTDCQNNTKCYGACFSSGFSADSTGKCICESPKEVNDYMCIDKQLFSSLIQVSMILLVVLISFI